MDVFEAIQERRSIRAYQDTPVPREKLEKILEAARLAPSAGNVEPWHFIAVTDREKRKIFSKDRAAKFLSEAPVVIVACGDKKASPKWCVIDVALAVENMVLTATNEGLSTCIVGRFEEKEVKETVKVPSNFEVLLLLAVGYSREELDLSGKPLHSVHSRKALSEVASEETFGKHLVPQKVEQP